MTDVDAPSPPLPMQLVPVILLGGYGPGFDAAARLHQCYASIAPGRLVDADQVVKAGIGTPLLDLKHPAHLEAGVPAAAADRLKKVSAVLLNTLQPELAPALGHVEDTYITVLDRDQGGFKKGTVVLVRRSDVLTEQYVFVFLRADLDSGHHHITGLDASASPKAQAPVARVQPHVTPRSATKNILTFALAETPFLPPPFGAMATGVLTILNLIFDSTAPTPPNPYTQLKEDLEKYLDQQELSDHALTPLDNVYTEITNDMKVLFAALGQPVTSDDDVNVPLDELDSIPTSLLHLWKMIDGDDVEFRSAGQRPSYFSGQLWAETTQAESFLWVTLKRKDFNDFTDTLSVLIQAVTQQVLLAKLSIQCRALACTVHLKEGDATAFDCQNETWRSQLRAIAEAIGVDPDTGKVPDPWTADLDSLTADQIKDGLASTAWIPRIRAWCASQRVARTSTDQISAVYRTQSPLEFQQTGGDGVTQYRHYWTFTDQQDTTSRSWNGYQADNGEWANRFEDTPSDSCCGDDIQHQDLAESARKSYIAAKKAALDSQFAPHLETASAWATLIGAFHTMLPPAAPQGGLTVRPAQAGAPADTSGTWVKGNVLRYQVAAHNADNGPGPAGPWSSDFTIGDTRGAVISGLPSPQGADSLWLYRQVRSATEKWINADNASIVGIITRDSNTKSMPSDCTDTAD